MHEILRRIAARVRKGFGTGVGHLFSYTTAAEVEQEGVLQGATGKMPIRRRKETPRAATKTSRGGAGASQREVRAAKAIRPPEK